MNSDLKLLRAWEYKYEIVSPGKDENLLAVEVFNFSEWDLIYFYNYSFVHPNSSCLNFVMKNQSCIWKNK